MLSQGPACDSELPVQLLVHLFCNVSASARGPQGQAPHCLPCPPQAPTCLGLERDLLVVEPLQSAGDVTQVCHRVLQHCVQMEVMNSGAR